MAYEKEEDNDLKRLLTRTAGGIDGAKTVQSDFANGQAAPITPVRTGGYGENAKGTPQRSQGEYSGTAKQAGTEMKQSSAKKAAPKKSAPAAKSADAARAGAVKVDAERKRKTVRADAARMRSTFMAQKSSNSNNAPGGGKGQEDRARQAEVDRRAKAARRYR
jgi:hypothetical protein